MDAQVLTELDHRLAARVLVVEARGLEAPVIHAAPVAHLLECLGWDLQAQPPDHRGRDARAPRRQYRRVRLAQQPGHLAEREHAVAGHVEGAGHAVRHGVLERVHHVVLVHELVARVEAQDHRHRRQREQLGVRGLDVRAQDIREAQDRHRGVRVALGEVVHRRLGLHDVPLDPAARRVRAPHRLVEESRVVLVAAVEVGRGLEDDLSHRGVRPRAGREDVHRPHHVVLVGLGRRGDRGVHHQARVHHGVDLCGLDHAPEQGVLRARPSRTRCARARRSAPRCPRRSRPRPRGSAPAPGRAARPSSARCR